MISLAVDTSVLIAILRAEPESRPFASLCHAAPSVVISTATVHEAFCVVAKSRMVTGSVRLEALLSKLELELIAFDAQHLAAARSAYARYGHGSGHPAQLNMGDCFAYALAKTRNVPLLFKGDDFIHTDIEPALKPA
jgi:ribonuclease VapC